jgi:hypothetical protein
MSWHVGAITFINIGVFHLVDPKFREMWVKPWLELFWPLWTIFFAPSAISALLACWFSRPSTWRNATALLGVYLFLMLVAIEIAWALDVQFLFLVGEFALLSMIFLTIAHWKSKQAYRRPSDYTASRTHDV